MRAAIYARVSTGEQTLENQLVALREFAAACAHQVVAEYTDTETGAADSRPGLDRMLADAARRRFDLLLFWSLDRLTRNGVLKTFKILERLESYGVKFRALQQPELDSSGPWGHVIIAVFAAMAQVERELLRERTRAGLRRARARGARIGRPRRPMDLEAVRAAKAQGKSLRQIARELSVPASTLRRYLN